MTREQARREIDSLDFYLQNHTDDYGEESHTAMMMAKDALSCSEIPNTCADAISRREALNAITMAEVRCQAVDNVNKLPSVTPQQRTGRWIHAKVGKLFPSNDFKCSKCGNILDFNGLNCGRGDANYCPNCGAKMKVEE